MANYSARIPNHWPRCPAKLRDGRPCQNQAWVGKYCGIHTPKPRRNTCRDELREAVAKAIYEAQRAFEQPITEKRIPPWDEILEYELCLAEHEADAAISCVVEACAQVAEAEQMGLARAAYPVTPEFAARDAAGSIAMAIRELAPEKA